MRLRMLNTWVIILFEVIVYIFILLNLINYFKSILIVINISPVRKGVIFLLASFRFLLVLNCATKRNPVILFMMELLTQCNFVS